jgi:hypothetical protein
VAQIVPYLRKQGVLSAISSQVCFARRRIARYEVIEFVAVQIALCHQWRMNAGGVL